VMMEMLDAMTITAESLDFCVNKFNGRLMWRAIYRLSPIQREASAKVCTQPLGQAKLAGRSGIYGPFLWKFDMESNDDSLDWVQANKTMSFGRNPHFLSNSAVGSSVARPQA
jgi:hypothetical protein